MTNVRVVIDTNVVFSGMTDPGSDDALIVEAWLSNSLTACISDALLYEYRDVLERKLSVQKWKSIKPVFARLVAEAEEVPIYFRWRPAAEDVGDDHVVDCAMNANAILITNNTRDFVRASTQLGLVVLTPTGLLPLILDTLEE
jgi:putative PIN family toxin of toxin-antitoxin system